ncbi:MAG: hypothetical protein N2445_06915, partial [Acidobacteria bacterium]|nr:hypothetical protein [Acidobacteriota bacterium]
CIRDSFSGYLNRLFEKEFKNQVYVVYAGGDDLFIIGPYKEIYELAKVIRDKLSEYSSGNRAITISAGYSIVKPEEPITRMGHIAEEELDKSKRGDKDQITIFGETVKWSELKELEEVKKTLEKYYKEELIAKSLLYDILSLLEQVKKEKERNQFKIEDIQTLMWRPLLIYKISRNVAKGKKKEEKERIQKEVKEKLFSAIEKYGGKIRIPLSFLLYEERKGD